jgi:hypothetical protein
VEQIAGLNLDTIDNNRAIELDSRGLPCEGVKPTAKQ